MTRACLFLIPAMAFAQDVVSRGADIFNKSCATGYCHGLKGASGGAPRLASRGFDQAYITKVVRDGVPGSAMPPFGTALSRVEMAAVVAYVGSLNGIAPAPNLALERGPGPRTFAPDAARGRALFYEATRGFGRCSMCHQVDGMGIPVADPMTKVPASVAELRAIPSPHAATVAAGGETFAALVLNKGAAQTKVYELTMPPVLRTFDSAGVKVSQGSGWKHSSAIEGYTDADLEPVLAFLRAVVK
jgi:mono/diheme cytochrome c family protein